MNFHHLIDEDLGDLILDSPLLSANEKHNFDVKLSNTTLDQINQEGGSQPNEIISNNNEREEIKIKELTQEDTNKLLSRVQPISNKEDDEKEFFMREKSIKAPKTGKRIEIPFPPPSIDRPPENLDPKKLEELSRQEVDEVKVERYSPSGELNTVSALSISFNQPMIALSSVSDVELMDIPATLSPAIQGKWVWKGTQNLQFESVHRFPKSTNYTVKLNAGFKSSAGGILKKDFSFQFSTTPVKLLSSYPHNNQRVPDLTPVFFLSFDQKIDQAAVLNTIKITSNSNNNGGNLVLMSEEEVKENKHIKWSISSALPGQWLAFKLSSELQKNTQYSVNIGPGTPSIEGSRLTTVAQTINFSTYPPFTISSVSPETGTYKASPKGTWSIYFSNEIDQNSLSKDLITITPHCEGIAITSSGTGITIRNYSKENTDYKVKISDKLKDTYGQSLTGKDEVTFRVGERTPNPSISAPQGMFVYDPCVSPPLYNVIVYEYKQIIVKVSQVTPGDYSNSALENYRVKNHVGKMIHDKVIDCKIDDPTTPFNFALDLRNLLQHEKSVLGQLLISVEPERKEYERLHKGSNYEYRQIIWSWIQCTNLGINVILSSNNNLSNYAIVSKLSDGTPIKGAKVTLGGSTKESNEHGIVELPNTTMNFCHAIAAFGDDVAFYPRISHHPRVNDATVWFAFDDRKLYKPKETVNIKGYIRVLTHKEDTVVPTYCSGDVSYTVYDPRGAQLEKGSTKLNKFGSFDIKFTLKDNVNLGEAYVLFQYKNGPTHYHYFKIQEFRRPEFEAKCSYSPTSNHVCSTELGGFVATSVRALYFAGGPLNDANVTWSLSATESTYSPPGHYGFSFGNEKPWWLYYSSTNTNFGSWSHAGKTDKDGEHHLRIDYVGNLTEKPPVPITISASASVQDINYQTMGASTSVLLHPSSYYVGYKAQKRFCGPGQTVPIEFIVTNIDGKLIDKAIVKLKVIRKWNEQKEDERGLAKWEEKEETFDYKLVSSGNKEKLSVFNFESKDKPGNYEFQFTVEDDRGRINKSSLDGFYVSGGNSGRKSVNQKTIPLEEVTLIPNKQTYEDGEKGELLVIAPFSPAHGTLTLDCEGSVFISSFEMKNETEIINFPIKKEWVPGVTIRVELNGSQFRTNDLGQVVKDKPKRPAHATGQISINISNKIFELDIVPTPSKKKTSPGDEIEIEVLVKDKKGNAAENVEVCLIVVDESVLALAGYNLSTPLSLFYPSRSLGQSSYRSRSNLLLFDVEDLKGLSEATLIIPQIQTSFGAKGSCYCCEDFCECCKCCNCCRSCQCSLNCDDCLECEEDEAGGGALESTKPIQVRTNFDALALFTPSLVTDKNGKCSTKFKLPDNLTRYRIWAMGADDKRYGLGESDVSALLPLMVRPSLPRFLNFGDRPDVNVVVQNQTDENLSVVLAMRCTNATIREGTGGYSFNLAPSQRINVQFPVATNFSGIARFQTVVASKDFADSSENEVPIFTPATTEAFATYGDVAEEKATVLQDIKPPSDVYSQFGGLEVSTSTTVLQSLTDSILYLHNYVYECNEQLASRVLGVGSLRDVLAAFKVKGAPSVETVNRKLSDGLQKLKRRQWASGGFSYWEPSIWTEESPYVSCHVGHALAICKQKKITYDTSVWEKLKQFLNNIERYIRHWYGVQTKNSIKCYALYVLAKYGEDVSAKALQLFKDQKLEDFPLEAFGWLLVALKPKQSSLTKDAINSIIKHLKNKANETAETANFVTSYGDDGQYVMLHSDRRTDGVLLEGLLEVDPKNSLNPKLAKGLLAHKKQGKWGNTQENSLILVALDKYFAVYEKDEPNFITHMWFGEDYTGEQKWKGRSTDTNIVKIPMKHIVETEETKPLIIQKEGKGRLYYRLGLDYAPKSLDLKAASYGFFITRSYEGVDDPKHVTKDENGVWHFALGQKVLVKIEMVTTSRRYHMALVDKLPAGLEIINPYLQGGAGVGGDVESRKTGGFNPYSWRWYHPTNWFEHQNLRDERAEAFQSLLWEGKYEYKYVTRATTKGSFVVPPAMAEEMYSPEVFGRSSTDKVVIN